MLNTNVGRLCSVSSLARLLLAIGSAVLLPLHVANAETPTAVQLPVRSQVSVIGFLPGQGDHRGRDQYAVDFAGGGGIVHSIAAGNVAYAGWNCQKASSEQATCYGFTMVIDHGPAAGGEIYSVYTHMDCGTLVQFSNDNVVLQGLQDMCTTTNLGANHELEVARGLSVQDGDWLGSISDSGCRDDQGLSHCVSPPGPDTQGAGKHLHFAVHKGAPGLVGVQALFDPSLAAVNVWDRNDPWHLAGLPNPPALGHIGPCWQISGPPDASCLLGNAPMTYLERQQLKQDNQVAGLIDYLPWQGDSVSADFDFRHADFVVTLVAGQEDAGNAEFDQFLHEHGVADRSWIRNLVINVQ